MITAFNARALYLVSAFALIALPVAIAEGERGYVIVCSVAVVGFAVVAKVGGRLPELDSDSSIRHLAETAVSWVLVAAGAAVVTFALGHAGDGEVARLADGWSAVFEGVSGVTSTGLTMVTDPSALDATLQWWRTILQWGGTVGVVAFALLFAEPSGDASTHLGEEWGHRPHEGPQGAALRIFGILVALTAVAVLALLAAGEPAWRALNHGFSAACTGGFVITSNSVASVPAPAQAVIAATTMISAISFAALWGAFTRKDPPLWKRTQVRWGLGLTAAAAVLAAVIAEPGTAVASTVFNSVSASTTAGFADGSSFAAAPQLTILTAASMFVGGAAGSTSGGVKVARVVWVAYAARRWLPAGNADAGEDQEEGEIWDAGEVDPREVRQRTVGATALLSLVVVTAVVVASALALTTGAPAGEAVFEAMSALLNIGLSVGVTSPDLPAESKGVLVVAMLVGRVEITAFLALALVVLRRPLDRSGAA